MNRIQEAYEQVHANAEMVESAKARLKAMREDAENDAVMDAKSDSQAKSRRKAGIDMSEVFSRIIHAESFKTMFGKNFNGRSAWYRIAAAAVMVVVLLLSGGYRINTRAASYISVDAAPSIEFTLNRFGKVLSVDAYNDSGAEILASLENEGICLTGCSYDNAIEILLNCADMEEALARDDVLTFTVLAGSDEESDKLAESVSSCDAVIKYQAETATTDKNCYEEAHDNGLSFGKYVSYLALKACNDSITADQCDDMSIGEIEEEISAHKCDDEGNAETGSHADSSNCSSECDDEENDCEDAENDCKDAEDDCEDAEDDCEDAEDDCEDAEDDCEDAENDCKDADNDCNVTGDNCKVTETNSKDTGSKTAGKNCEDRADSHGHEDSHGHKEHDD